MLLVNLLRGGRPKQLFEVYFIKAIRYVFLVDVIFLFSISQAGGILLINDLIISGLILFIYFVGRIQSKQEKQLFFTFRGQTNIPGVGDILKSMRPIFDLRFEVGVVVLALGIFIGFYFAPALAENKISNWFLESILNIEDTPVFGFVFKVIGFFFLLSVLMKVVGGILVVLSGGKTTTHQDQNDDNHFDDYTEVK